MLRNLFSQPKIRALLLPKGSFRRDVDLDIIYMLLDENAMVCIDHTDAEAPLRVTLDVEDASGRVIHITGVYAILRFLARGRNLYPECDALNASYVDSFLDIHNDVMQGLMQPMCARSCLEELYDLNGHLRERDWIVGDRVSIADAAWAVLVDAVLSGGTSIPLDISECKHLIEHRRRTFEHFNVNHARSADSPKPESSEDDSEEDDKMD